MATLKLIVFNVEVGRCIYVRTPNDHGVLIDCKDCSKEPMQWLDKHETPSLKQYMGNAISSNIDEIDDPKFGATIRRFALTRQEAESLGGDAQQQSNNMNAVTIVDYKSPDDYAWKVVIADNQETSAWEVLLSKPEFCAAIKDTDFFITSQHGQESGFSADLFKITGKTIANITSSHPGIEPANTKYKKTAQGVKFPDGSRTHFMTRDDGSITVEMHDDGRYDVWLFTPLIEGEKI